MSDRSARRRLLLSRDDLLGLVAVLVLAAVCVGLGFWQWGRFEDRRDQAAVVEANYEAAPIPLDEAMPDPQAPLPTSETWTPVQMRGSYCQDPDCVLYVRNRQIGGQIGFWQLVPFTAEDGTTLLIVRGWVPEDSTASSGSIPADPPAIPSGEVTVTARLRPAEPVLDRVPPPGQAHSVNPPQIASLLSLEYTALVTQAYGDLVAEDPAGPRPTALEAPDTGLGPHLSYAFQWWVFAAFFPAALVFRVRKQFQDLDAEEAEDTETSGTAAVPHETADGADTTQPGADAPVGRTPDHRHRRAVRTRKRGQDEEEEDALIDQRRQ